MAADDLGQELILSTKGQGKAKTPATELGRWIRVAEWAFRAVAWRIYEAESMSFAVDAITLRERSEFDNGRVVGRSRRAARRAVGSMATMRPADQHEDTQPFLPNSFRIIAVTRSSTTPHPGSTHRRANLGHGSGVLRCETIASVQ